jgi:hypothetical protein
VGVDVEIAEHSHDDIALRMILGFGFADSAGVDQVLNVAVILRHADDVPVAEQVGA